MNGIGPRPPAPVMMGFKCLQCQGEILAPAPIYRAFNAPDVSALVYTHTKLTKCPTCGTQYICLVHGVDNEGRVMLQWTPVQTTQSAIVPPTGENMAKAIAATNLDKKIKTQ